MIKFASIFFIFACGAGVALASGDVSSVVFTTNSQTIKLNEISEIISIQTQDASGVSADILQTACLELAANSNTGEFSSSNTNWNPVKILTMSKGSANRNFYYKDSIVGNYELSVKVSLRPEGKPACASWPKEEWDIKWNAKQNVIVSSGFSNASSQENQSSSASNSSSLSSAGEVIASGSVAYNYKNEQISAKAGEDKTAVAGADIVLEGNALGFKKEPLQNARYLWTLGDGSYKEGKNIRHIYKYPGNYIAVLNVSSGDVSASDRINIKIIPNELRIIETKNEFIKLKNKSGIILDISGWFLKAGGAIFKFPDYSLVAANSELMISSDVSGIKFAGNNFSAELLYPNGSVAFSYLPAGEAGLPVSFSSSSSISKPKEIISSQPPERKVDVAIAPFVPLKSSSSSSAAADKGQNFAAEINLPHRQAGLPAGESGLASVITIGDKNNSGSKIWLILAVITGIIGGAGVFVANKFTYIEK